MPTVSVLGGRGQRPIRLPIGPEDPRLGDVVAIPGVFYDGREAVWCAWDVGPIVARHLGYQLPEPPFRSPDVQYPGYPKYLELEFDKKLRWYQHEAVEFLMQRAWALHCDGMRTGKTLGLIAADTIVGSRRTLVVGPALAKWVWARELAKWTGESAFVIEGRKGAEGRQYCVPCAGMGVMDDGRPCLSCTNRNGQSYGYVLYEVLGATRTSIARTERGALYSIVPIACEDEDRRYSLWPRQYHCPLHESSTSSVEGTVCQACQIEFTAHLKSARYVLSNYDILTQHHDHDAAGVEHARGDLPGFADSLRRVKFDVAILDEIQRIRGRTKPDRWGLSTRDRLKRALEPVQIVWGATGTPIFGFMRDYYSILDVVSGGLFGQGFKIFDTRYCEGQIGAYGWEANGCSILATTEFVERRKFFEIKRTRKDLFGDLDKKQRQVIVIEPKKALRRDEQIAHMGPELAYDVGLRKILPDVLEALVENAVNELAEGLSLVVFTKLVESSKQAYLALERAILKPSVAARMRAVDAKLWLANGGVAPSARLAMADRFREHAKVGQRAGIFVATIDAFQVAASLGGAANVHFAELALDPAANEQAEDRAFEVGCGLLGVVYYIVKGSVSQHAQAILLPKLEAQEKVTGDQQAADIRMALGGRNQREKMNAAAIYARLTAHLPTAS